MEKNVIVFLIIATVLRIILGFIQKDVWKIKTYKYFIIAPVMSLVGTFGAKLASFIAYGRFSGTRLYGTVLALAVFGFILAIILCIPYEELYGFSSVGTWLSITIMKIPCIINGCCAGRVLFVDGSGNSVLFPSQIMETLIAAIFFIWFYKLSKSNYPHSAMFPLMMIWYGIYRYVFDWFRGHPLEQSPFFMWMPAGRFFSIIIMVVGFVSLFVVLKKKDKKELTINSFIKYLFGKN